MPKRCPTFESTAEVYLALLKSRGIDWLFANAGTDFAPIIEALVRGRKAGIAMPTAIVSWAIGTAVGIAIPALRPRTNASMMGAKSVPALANSQSMPRLFSRAR